MHPADSPLHWQALRLPKQGHTEAEYEDAWVADPARGRFAVADGASESAFAGLWAGLLTEGFRTAAQPRRLPSWLGAARRAWSAAVSGLELPWYAEIKRDEGAFATFLGLSVRRSSPPRPGTPRRGVGGEGGAARGLSFRWGAVAVGDSCLVRVRKDGQLRAFPLRRSVDFGNQPALLRSRGIVDPAPRRCSGSLRRGDRLFLMTDALAQWFLNRHESGERPWEALTVLLSAPSPEADFAAWVEEQRHIGALRDDDVTLLSLQLGSASVGGTP